MRTNLGSESAGMRLFDTDMCLPHLGPISANSPPNRKGLRTELSNRCWLCYEFFGKTIVSSPLITGWTLTAVILSCTESAAAARPARASKYRPSITIMIIVQCISISVALALSAGESPTRDRGPGGSLRMRWSAHPAGHHHPAGRPAGMPAIIAAVAFGDGGNEDEEGSRATRSLTQ
jgi:hypothetical protein